ncbi:MAG: hypothetical protein ABFS45_08540, partial [Pseudomonadota bacterium]
CGILREQRGLTTGEYDHLQDDHLFVDIHISAPVLGIMAYIPMANEFSGQNKSNEELDIT